MLRIHPQTAKLAYACLFTTLPLAASLAANASTTYGTVPVGGKYKDCHGYVRHVSLANIRVHCIDGIPSDMSFISYPKFVDLPGGKTIQSKDLKTGTPVHVIYTQSLGVRHAYKVYVANPRGHGLYGFKA
ncbi:MAG: hypothetical protein JO060_00350 [Candidatus Eremiobacteraeota bacterium]|nr:hypothetical protein [Candidatus Eremiobacteraeota bacterium]MBV9647124.1 hypothetical protein [Candidatus Eremiobacteraeota bacterium]